MRERESNSLRIRKLTPKEIIFYLMGLCGIINKIGEEIYDKRICPLLSVLWQEIGKKEIQEQIRRFWCVQKKEILQYGMYEQSILESWQEQSKIQFSSYNIKKNNEENFTSNTNLCRMWETWKVRYTPYRWELSKQQFEQFNLFMQELSQQETSTEKNMQNLWETYEGFRILQQTLYKIQEIWESTLPQKQSQLRIRKLVPLETMKLMGFTEEDYKSMRDIGMSDAAIYHCAGDSIVTTVLVGIFGTMIENCDTSKAIQEYVENEIVKNN